jgi:SAM-dependent methyltransferase
MGDSTSHGSGALERSRVLPLGRNQCSERDHVGYAAHMRGTTVSSLDLDALEIGCGVGRMTRMMARIFRSVTAVDVSTEMVERAKTHLKGLDNVTVVWGMALPFQRWRKHPFDFAFSFIVFQHIPASRWWRRTVGKYAGFFGLAGCLSSSSRAHIGPVMNPQIPGADYRSLKRSRACYCTQAFWLWFRKSSEAAGASFSGPLASDQRALE